jgi:AraC-like DNA-binding protein
LTLQATVSMSWVNTVLGAAQRQGLERAHLLAAAGIALTELDKPRWPIDHITRLWRAAAELTQDPGFGLKAGALVGPASFNVVSYILQSSPTLRAAIAVVQQFQRLISDGGRFQTIAGASASWIVYHPRQGELAFSPHQLEAVLAAVLSFSRWVTDSTVSPLRVQFSQSALGPLAGYRAAFNCPVDFEQAFSGLLLDNALLDRPLPQADAQLASVHRQYAAARLAALSESGNFSDELRAWLAGHLVGRVPTRQHAAQAFGLSPRTFARRLQQEGLHYSALVDGARQQLACEAVQQPTQLCRHCPVAGLCRSQRLQPRVSALDRHGAGAVAGGAGRGHARTSASGLSQRQLLCSFHCASWPRALANSGTWQRAASAGSRGAATWAAVGATPERAGALRYTHWARPTTATAKTATTAHWGPVTATRCAGGSSQAPPGQSWAFCGCKRW